MNLYEINNEILNCVDEETGEIVDFERLQELQIEKNIQNRKPRTLVQEFDFRCTGIKK